MARNASSRSKNGRRKIDRPRITLIDYDSGHFLEKEVASLEECLPFNLTSTVTWINVDGVHDPDVVEKLGSSKNWDKPSASTR